MSGRSSRADFLLLRRGLGLGAEDMHRLAPMLGFDAPPVGGWSEGPTSEPKQSGTRASELVQAPVLDGKKRRMVRAARVPFFRLDRVEFDDTPPEERQPPPIIARPFEAHELAPLSHVTWPKTPPHAEWPEVWPRLFELIATARSSREIDTPQLVREISQQQAMRRLPRRARRTWPGHLTVLCDRSTRLRPIWTDQNDVVEGLRRLLGEDGVRSVDVFAGREAPTASTGDVCLALSDLGLRGSAVVADWWVADGRRRRARGEQLAALMPMAPRRVDAEAPPIWRASAWSPSHTWCDDRSEEGRIARARGLLIPLVIAHRLEHGLLRELRQALGLDGGDLGTELDLWSSPWLSAGDGPAAAFRAATVEGLRRDFLRPDRVDDKALALRLLQRWHGLVFARDVWPEEKAALRELLLDASDELRSVLEAVLDDLRERTDELGARVHATVRSGAPELAAKLASWLRGYQARAPTKVFARAGAARDATGTFNPWYQAVLEAPRRSGEAAVLGDGLRPCDLVCGDGRVEPSAWLHSAHGIIQAGEGSPLAVLPSTGEGFAYQVRGAPPTSPSVGAPLCIEPATLRPSEPVPSWATRARRDDYGRWAEVDIEGVTLRLRYIEPGTFWMGPREDGEERFANEGPRHQVTLTEGYWMAEVPVTQGLWRAVTGESPGHFEGDEGPVEQVSWQAVVAFVEKLNAMRPGLQLCLPTEAQWEYACRAGSEAARYAELDAVAWWAENSNGQTHPVGEKQPNAWGLHDMLGSVYEWCQDFYGPYETGHAYDPTGPREGTGRVLRGGCWYASAQSVRAAHRFGWRPSNRGSDVGFRLSRGHGVPSQQEGPGGSSGRPGPRGTSAQGAEPSPRSGALGDALGWSCRLDEDEFGCVATIEVPSVYGGDAVPFRLRWIPPGTFKMGSPESDEDGCGAERPQRDVTFTGGYWLAETPVSQALWCAVTGGNPSRFKGSERPVEQVSREDVMAFVETLNNRFSSLELRLPTEAQWEYACRAGTEASRHSDLDAVAWYAGNSGQQTHPVGEKQPNAWGLHDMLGNVWEWCADWDGRYDSGPAYDPIGPHEGSERVLRGGSWFDDARYLRPASRDANDPSIRLRLIGFRLSRGPSAPGQYSPQEPGGLLARPGPRGTSGQGAEPERRSRTASAIVLVTDRAEAHLNVFERPEWASRVGRDRFGLFADVKVEAFVPVVFRMRWMPPGRFQMGSPAGEVGHEDQEIQHLVTLTEGFWMADTPCTQKLWAAVMGDHSSHFRSPLRPVKNVSWDTTQEFLQALNQQTPGLEARLPTEAWWEYACRAGTTTATHAGDLSDVLRSPNLDPIAWYGANSDRGFDLDNGERTILGAKNASTHPVAQLGPNPWGLYDMHGNVWEWCHDFYGPYDSDHAYDPIGPHEGTQRVLRGGSWSSSAQLVRAAYRRAHGPSRRYPHYGFRLSRGHRAPSQVSPQVPEPAGGTPGPRGTSGQGADPKDERSPSGDGGRDEGLWGKTKKLFGFGRGEED